MGTLRGAVRAPEPRTAGGRTILTTLANLLPVRCRAPRHREAAERTLLTAIAAVTERASADSGHSLDFINKAFE